MHRIYEREVIIMAYCKNCGSVLDDGATFCASCGTAQNTAPAVKDEGGFGWSLLGCCFPVVALILYLVWKDTKPNTAQAVCHGAIVGVILSLVSNIISAVIGAAGYYM